MTRAVSEADTARDIVSETAPEQLSYEIDGLTYAGLAWGSPGQPVVLALHGWLDNALSFSVLAPALSGYRVVALDLSGHGLSSHRSADATYHIWDDLPQLEAIVALLDAPSVTIMGHSRGAGIALQLAAVLGERCHRVIVLDGLLPAWLDQRDAADQLQRFVREKVKYASRDERYFESIDAFVERRRQYGFSDDSAYKLAPRALEQCPDGLRLRNDPRLYGASALSLGPEQRRQLYASVSAPTLCILAGDGLFNVSEVAQQMFREAQDTMPHFICETVAGSHHLHMEAAAVAELAPRLQGFIQTGR